MQFRFQEIVKQFVSIIEDVFVREKITWLDSLSYNSLIENVANIKEQLDMSSVK